MVAVNMKSPDTLTSNYNTNTVASINPLYNDCEYSSHRTSISEEKSVVHEMIETNAVSSLNMSESRRHSLNDPRYSADRDQKSKKQKRKIMSFPESPVYDPNPYKSTHINFLTNVNSSSEHSSSVYFPNTTSSPKNFQLDPCELGSDEDDDVFSQLVIEPVKGFQRQSFLPPSLFELPNSFRPTFLCCDSHPRSDSESRSPLLCCSMESSSTVTSVYSVHPHYKHQLNCFQNDETSSVERSCCVHPTPSVSFPKEFLISNRDQNKTAMDSYHKSELQSAPTDTTYLCNASEKYKSIPMTQKMNNITHTLLNNTHDDDDDDADDGNDNDEKGDDEKYDDEEDDEEEQDHCTNFNREYIHNMDDSEELQSKINYPHHHNYISNNDMGILQSTSNETSCLMNIWYPYDDNCIKESGSLQHPSGTVAYQDTCGRNGSALPPFKSCENLNVPASFYSVFESRHPDPIFLNPTLDTRSDKALECMEEINPQKRDEKAYSPWCMLSTSLKEATDDIFCQSQQNIFKYTDPSTSSKKPVRGTPHTLTDPLNSKSVATNKVAFEVYTEDVSMDPDKTTFDDSICRNAIDSIEDCEGNVYDNKKDFFCHTLLEDIKPCPKTVHRIPVSSMLSNFSVQESILCNKENTHHERDVRELNSLSFRTSALPRILYNNASPDDITWTNESSIHVDTKSYIHPQHSLHPECTQSKHMNSALFSSTNNVFQHPSHPSSREHLPNLCDPPTNIQNRREPIPMETTFHVPTLYETSHLSRDITGSVVPQEPTNAVIEEGILEDSQQNHLETQLQSSSRCVDSPHPLVHSKHTQSKVNFSSILESLDISPKIIQEIDHSSKYRDDVYEYRFVTFPRNHPFLEFEADNEIRQHLMSEAEWRALGIRQTRGWEHFGYSRYETHVFLFRRPIGTDSRTGKLPAERQDIIAERTRNIQESKSMLNYLNGHTLSSKTKLYTLPTVGSTSWVGLTDPTTTPAVTTTEAIPQQERNHGFQPCFINYYATRCFLAAMNHEHPPIVEQSTTPFFDLSGEMYESAELMRQNTGWSLNHSEVSDNKKDMVEVSGYNETHDVSDINLTVIGTTQNDSLSDVEQVLPTCSHDVKECGSYTSSELLLEHTKQFLSEIDYLYAALHMPLYAV